MTFFNLKTKTKTLKPALYIIYIMYIIKGNTLFQWVEERSTFR